MCPAIIRFMETEQRKIYTSVCQQCGVVFERSMGKPKKWCHDHANAAVISQNLAARNKSGPTYEKQVRGQLKHWHAEARRLGITK
jgi:hypothetical protein